MHNIHNIQFIHNTIYTQYNIRSLKRTFQDYFEYFAPDYTLHPDTTTKIENQNTRTYLDNVMTTVEETLRNLSFAPSVQMQEVRGYIPVFFNFLFIHPFFLYSDFRQMIIKITVLHLETCVLKLNL